MSNSALDTSHSFIYEAPNETGSPERLLILAMIERAILDFVGNDRKEAEEAEEWLFSGLEDSDPEPYSFSWACRELGLDPLSVAKIIRDMPKRGTNRVAPWYFSRPSKAPESSNSNLANAHSNGTPTRTKEGASQQSSKGDMIRVVKSSEKFRVH